MRFADRYKAPCVPQCIPADCWPPECPPPDYQPPPVITVDRSPVMPIPAYVPPPPPPPVITAPVITARPALYQIRPRLVGPSSQQLRGLGGLGEDTLGRRFVIGAVVGAAVGYAVAKAQRKTKQKRSSWTWYGSALGAAAAMATKI